jgi:glycolate oxidase FAD binding subunit
VTTPADFVPETIDAAASRIAESERSGEVVAIIGGGTDFDIGNAPDRAGLVIRTTRLDRVVEHAPSDQIIAVEAGATLARVQEVVRAHGQRLALDPPQPDRATIGGIVAANAFGPLRTRFGSVRDLIIGISIIRADGVIAHGGGKVVKNVAGFDLPKLMVGSLGTLGMIATVTFRLHPLPENSETLLLTNRNAAPLRKLIADMRQSQLEPAAAVAIAHGTGFDVAVRFEGFRAGVVAQRDRLSRLSNCEVLDAAGAKRFWSRHDAIRAAGPIRIKVAALPSEIERVGSTLDNVIRAMNGGGFVWYPMTGLGFVTGTAVDEHRIATAIESARKLFTLTIAGAPAGVGAWGEPSGAYPLMQAMKQKFDPGRRFAPGRFVGGI